MSIGPGNDEDVCAICKAKLGKLNFNPRHHCRVCDKAVCGDCSPHNVQLTDKGSPERVCKLCLQGVKNAREYQNRINDLAKKLHIVQGKSPPSPALSIEDALTNCERGIPPPQIVKAAPPPSNIKRTNTRGLDVSQLESDLSMKEAEVTQLRQARLQKLAQLQAAQVAGFAESSEMESSEMSLGNTNSDLEQKVLAARAEAEEQRKAREKLEADVLKVESDSRNLVPRLTALGGGTPPQTEKLSAKLEWFNKAIKSIQARSRQRAEGGGCFAGLFSPKK